MNTEIIAIFTENGFTLDTEPTKEKQVYTSENLLSDFKSDPDKALLYFGFEDKSTQMSQSLMFIHGISAYFTEKLSKNPDIEITHSAQPLTGDEKDAMLQKSPYAIGAEFITVPWLDMIWGRLTHTFEFELASFDGSAAQYLLTRSSHINVAGRVFFHLVENKSAEYPFAFLATYSRKSSDSNKAEHVPLKNALLEYKGDQKLLLQLLGAVSKAADRSDFISELVESGELFSPLQFAADEAYTFLKEIPLYEECGIMCRMPDWWRKKYNTIKVTVGIGEKAPSHVGLTALLSFNPEISLGGEVLTREELESLLSQTAGLSFLKGKWVEIDHEKLRAALEAYDNVDAMSEDGVSLLDAMRLQMGLGKIDGLAVDDAVEISNGKWLSGVMANLKAPERLTNIDAGNEFKARLRRYQQNGLDWLATMKTSGFGAMLADDMGLGKTVQILALLEYMRQSGSGDAGGGGSGCSGSNGDSGGSGGGSHYCDESIGGSRYCDESSGGSRYKTLLIIPASLIGNWKAEIERFAPKLRFYILHGSNTEIVRDDYDLFITTYGMAVRLETLNTQKWDIVILDEAQAIKNPGTKQTKAVKSIPASFHIAMTGTPVENRMSDLWSLFDFLNAGLLGTSKEFSNYAKSIQSNESYAKLRSVINPFILRRLKTDKSIISDLPDKVEMKIYGTLTKKQVVLYNALVKDLAQTIETMDGIERKGVVLASLMKFKQICNHPDQYLGQSVFDHTQSGKFKLLEEICETIHDKRERVLVFTQFREMCDPLSEYLETLFGKKGLVLHGGTAVKKRAELVEKFNGEEYIPYMVLSLKAGGVGLNLTAANHVIHFDRWWNPAVENQATDRAFRIGQKKNVLVHKFITTGTVEEKIDTMIENKLNLSSQLIASSGESWITEMSSKDLLNLFKLEI